MENFEAMLRGVSFRPIEAKAIVNELAENTLLVLEREADNPYDSNAVKVLYPENNMHLGYVAKEIAIHLAPLMDAGRQFECHTGTRFSSSQLALLIEEIEPA